MWRLIAALLVLGAPAMAQAELDWSADERGAVARHGPWPSPPLRDVSNRVSGEVAAIALGEHLFGDPRLSADGQMSCATCHRPDREFSDGRAKAMGRVALERRTPSLWNVGYARWFGWDGAGDSLWAQSIRPILDEREMGGSAPQVAALVRGDSALACGYRRAFGHEPGADDEKLLVDLAKALAAFQATLVSPRTPFDSFRDALLADDREAMARYPLASQRGLKLFIGAGSCSTCHFGPRFTNGEFADIGIPFFVGPGAVDPGRLEGLAKLAKSPFNLLSRHNDDASGASGVRTRHVQRLHANFGEFRVPGLRQSARAAAFMHNGHFAALEEVVRHYSEVSPDRLHSDGTPLVRALALNAEQSADLISFLRSLSADPPPRPPPPPLCP
jgi:cytochrome c peroxidase